MTRKVLMADVSGGRVLGRPKLGVMDAVKVMLCSRGTTVEPSKNAQKIGRSRENWCICR